MNGLFITGTDTNVGKTFVCAWLAAELRKSGQRAGVYKPVCSGAEWDRETGIWRWPDLEQLAAAIDPKFSQDLICPQKFLAALAPPVAAAQEEKTVDWHLLKEGASRWNSLVGLLLVEGVGGWLSPVTDCKTVADLAVELGYPVLVVAPNRLGVINHVLLTLQAIRAVRLPVAGVLLNQVDAIADTSGASNLDLLKRFTDYPVWGPIPYQNCDNEEESVLSASWDWTSLLESLKMQ